jgi:hypothetical protein
MEDLVGMFGGALLRLPARFVPQPGIPANVPRNTNGPQLPFRGVAGRLPSYTSGRVIFTTLLPFSLPVVSTT